MKNAHSFNRGALRLFMVALLLLASMVVNAYDFEAVNDDGVTIYYDKSGSTATVTYKVLYEENYSGSVVIPETVTYDGVVYTVTSIGNYAFDGCHDLTNLIIPNTVTSIGKYVCWYCTNLVSLTIGDSVASIGKYAFSNCTRLESLTIGNSVTTIERNAFQNCGSLTSLTIPNSVTSIGDDAFVNCTGLVTVTIGNSVTSIGTYAFRACIGLQSIYTLNPDPPTCSSSVFYNMDTGACLLYVPKGSKESYSSAYVWKDFYTIVEFDANPVTDIAIDGRLKAAGYYTTDGKLVSSPQRGINIIRYSDGTAKKVLFK